MAELKEVEILLVEDNPNDVELTLRALKKQNLANSVFVVNDGAEALDYLYKTGRFAGTNARMIPKVILLDLKLPKVSGIEVLQKIKNDPDKRVIPVVVLTSSREEPDIKRCYELGVNSYIVKPVDFGKFIEAVASLGLYWLLMNQPPR